MLVRSKQQNLSGCRGCLREGLRHFVSCLWAAASSGVVFCSQIRCQEEEENFVDDVAQYLSEKHFFQEPRGLKGEKFEVASF